MILIKSQLEYGGPNSVSQYDSNSYTIESNKIPALSIININADITILETIDFHYLNNNMVIKCYAYNDSSATQTITSIETDTLYTVPFYALAKIQFRLDDSYELINDTHMVVRIEPIINNHISHIKRTSLDTSILYSGVYIYNDSDETITVSLLNTSTSAFTNQWLFVDNIIPYTDNGLMDGFNILTWSDYLTDNSLSFSTTETCSIDAYSIKYLLIKTSYIAVSYGWNYNQITIKDNLDNRLYVSGLTNSGNDSLIKDQIRISYTGNITTTYQTFDITTNNEVTVPLPEENRFYTMKHKSVDKYNVDSHNYYNTNKIYVTPQGIYSLPDIPTVTWYEKSGLIYIDVDYVMTTGTQAERILLSNEDVDNNTTEFLQSTLFDNKCRFELTPLFDTFHNVTINAVSSINVYSLPYEFSFRTSTGVKAVTSIIPGSGAISPVSISEITNDLGDCTLSTNDGYVSLYFTDDYVIPIFANYSLYGIVLSEFTLTVDNSIYVSTISENIIERISNENKWYINVNHKHCALIDFDNMVIKAKSFDNEQLKECPYDNPYYYTSNALYINIYDLTYNQYKTALQINANGNLSLALPVI